MRSQVCLTAVQIKWMQTEPGVQTCAQSWAQAKTHTHTESVFSVIWEAEICCAVVSQEKRKMLSSCLRLYVIRAFNIAFFVFGLVIIWVLVNTFWLGFLYSKPFPHPFIFNLLLCGMFLSPKYRVTMWGMLISELNCQRRWTV